ncbi:hypothetical protein EG834_12865 [bacterium]|nr:hypothetical protein [bacterium]
MLKPDQEIKLRRYIRDHVSSAFVLISDSSLIFGKGFADITWQEHLQLLAGQMRSNAFAML